MEIIKQEERTSEATNTMIDGVKNISENLYDRILGTLKCLVILLKHNFNTTKP